MTKITKTVSIKEPPNVSDEDKTKFTNEVNKINKINLDLNISNSHVDNDMTKPDQDTCMYYSTNNDVLLYAESPPSNESLDVVIEDNKKLIPWLKDDNNLLLYYSYVMRNKIYPSSDVVQAIQHRSDKLVQLMKAKK
jgi:hypothetical protein